MLNLTMILICSSPKIQNRIYNKNLVKLTNIVNWHLYKKENKFNIFEIYIAYLKCLSLIHRDVPIMRKMNYNREKYTYISCRYFTLIRLLHQANMEKINNIAHLMDLNPTDEVKILIKKDINHKQIILYFSYNNQSIYSYNKKAQKFLFFPNSLEKMDNYVILKTGKLLPFGGAYIITSAFGYRFHPILKRRALHKGIDLIENNQIKDSMVYAIEDGIAICSKANDYGNFVFLKHNNNIQTRYAHLSSILVKNGQKIKKGDLLGVMGNTGYSTAAHLHLEFIVNEKLYNPVSSLVILINTSSKQQKRQMFLYKIFINKLIEKIMIMGDN